MSYLRAYLIKVDRLDPSVASAFSTSQLWQWHVEENR